VRLAAGVRLVDQAYPGGDGDIVLDRRVARDMAIGIDLDTIADRAFGIDDRVVPDPTIVADPGVLADHHVYPRL